MPNRIGFRRFIDAKKQITPFKFDPALVTFTAGMSKRNSAGPFAAGVISQRSQIAQSGGDSLTLSRGNQISNNWYQVIDPYQGSIVFWITPEWNGSDGISYDFISLGNSACWILKNASNALAFQFGSINFSVSISSWTAGSTYSVVCRWDKNTIDGTNYACISINDVHSFGGTVAYNGNPAGTNLILSGATTSPNSIIEGLTIFRRPLFDGSYGIDVGNSDEIALIYNGGVGADPASITGSWDIVFMLPTDSDTSTPLVTG